jgi:hypothetical protein
MTIADVILNNNWKATSVKDSTALNAMLSSGIVSDGGQDATDLLNALNEDNINSKITTALHGYDWAEGNLGDASATVATALQPNFDEVDAKVNYVNQWWNVKTIQRDLLKSTRPNETVNEFIGRFWTETFNKVIANTVVGLQSIVSIVEDAGAVAFTSDLVLDTMLLKGDMGMAGLDTMQMNSATFINAKKAEPTMFTQTFGAPILQVVNGVETVVQGRPTGWLYDGYVKVVIDDTMNDSYIALINKGAFAFAEKENIEEPLMYHKDAKAGNGAGSEDWGTKKAYIMHPLGFTFSGTTASKSGATMAELQGGTMYTLVVDVKLSPITFLKYDITV